MSRQGFEYYDPKKRMIKRIIIAVVLVAIAVLIAVTIVKAKKKRDREQTSIEWFIKQADYLDGLLIYSGNMDDIVSLYLSGEITISDFVIHLSQLKGEINLLSADYDNYLEKHPIKLGTETAETKTGTNAVSALIATYKEIITMMDTYKTDKETLAYNYMAYSQVITKHLSEYLAARFVIYDKAGIKATPIPDSYLTPKTTPGADDTATNGNANK